MPDDTRVDLRPTTTGDLPAVLSWERHRDNASYVQAWPEERHRAALTDPSRRHFMIEADGRSVGYVILCGVEGAKPAVELLRIVVAEKGRGFGRAAVDRVVRHAFGRLRAREVWLDVVAHNHRARHVYESCGFAVDPSADLQVEIRGVSTPLVKMTLLSEASAGR